MTFAGLRFCSRGPRPVWAMCAAALLALSLGACGTTRYHQGMLDYKLGIYGVAVRNFNAAAKAGDPRAQFMLGWYWANGVGKTPKNFGQACAWYKKASDQGLPAAMNNLGACYECPCIMQHDINRAIALYTLAARKGEPHAQANLVRLGHSVPPVNPVSRVVRQQLVDETPQARADEEAGTTYVPPNQDQSASNESSASDWGAALAIFLGAMFAASKEYAPPPPSYFAAPMSIHCTTLAYGQMASTNCN